MEKTLERSLDKDTAARIRSRNRLYRAARDLEDTEHRLQECAVVLDDARKEAGRQLSRATALECRRLHTATCNLMGDVVRLRTSFEVGVRAQDHSR